MGANALARLDRNVLAQPGVRSVIVLLGINDVAWPGTAFAPGATRPTLDDLVSGYRQFIAQAHLRGVRVIGTTLTPFEGALPGTPLADYYDPGKERLRQAVNAWIRTSDAFDAVLDADRVLRDTDRPSRLAARDALRRRGPPASGRRRPPRDRRGGGPRRAVRSGAGRQVRSKRSIPNVRGC